MELKEFITNTLISITQGVNDAKTPCKEMGGDINPFLYGGSFSDIKYIPIDKIEFEVALSENNTTKDGKGIGVALSVLSVNGKKATENEIKSLTKIKFSVPIKLP